MQECFGKGLLIRVQFRHRANGPISAYEDFFQVPISFNASFNALVLSTKELHTRQNRRGRPEMRCSLEQRLQCLRQELGLDNTDGFSDIRRAVMYNAIKGDYSVSSLAQHLGMSLSSLQRRLGTADLTASSLLEEARYVNAMGLLSDYSLSVDEVAFRLGFESDRGFRKAFKRWAGKTPAEARREIKSMQDVQRHP
ncbi:MAG: AraC family transcriptional regulator [Candidatus Electrothrix sp. AR3]|nr:AraC family transcriptional regulator [Candidatus Electrothrix sp. AR3]